MKGNKKEGGQRAPDTRENEFEWNNRSGAVIMWQVEGLRKYNISKAYKTHNIEITQNNISSLRDDVRFDRFLIEALGRLVCFPGRLSFPGEKDAFLVFEKKKNLSYKIINGTRITAIADDRRSSSFDG